VRLIFSVAAAVVFLAGCGSKTDSAGDAGAQGCWTVDKSASRLEFSGTQITKAFTGSFSDFNASIDFDPDDLDAARIEVVVATGSARTGDRQRDAALPTKDWFAVSAFPEATFVADDIVTLGEDRYEAHGVLTIRDASRPLALPFSLAIDGDKAVAEGETTLVRTDFGVGQGDFTTDEWVGLDVRVAFHIEATR